MKITHICLIGPVTDGWTYQENLLPKYHKALGYDVSIIASEWMYNNKGSMVRDNRSTYVNENGITVVRIKNSFKTTVNSKFKVYKRLFLHLKNENPDIIFLHGVQMLDVFSIVKYIKKNRNVKLFVDNHSDFSNSATNWLSKNILHKIIWRYCANMILPYTEKFYGVLPARVDFLTDVYKLPKEKCELLVMGADDEKINSIICNGSRERIRKYYDIKNDDFLIVTGGKIDLSKKQTLMLMEAVKNCSPSKIKLLVFGSVVSALKEVVEQLCDNEFVKYIGWVEASKLCEYFIASDLAVFPGRHSVLWEEVAGTGTPMVCKYWPGITHIDVGGNVEFIKEDSVENIESIIKNIAFDDKKYQKMKQSAEKEAKNVFLYSNIAKRSLGE